MSCSTFSWCVRGCVGECECVGVWVQEWGISSRHSLLARRRRVPRTHVRTDVVSEYKRFRSLSSLLFSLSRVFLFPIRHSDASSLKIVNNNNRRLRISLFSFFFPSLPLPVRVLLLYASECISVFI